MAIDSQKPASRRHVIAAGLGAIGSDDPNNQELYLQASPAAIGTLAYLAYETRRLFELIRGLRNG